MYLNFNERPNHVQKVYGLALVFNITWIAVIYLPFVEKHGPFTNGGTANVSMLITYIHLGILESPMCESRGRPISPIAAAPEKV